MKPVSQAHTTEHRLSHRSQVHGLGVRHRLLLQQTLMMMCQPGSLHRHLTEVMRFRPESLHRHLKEAMRCQPESLHRHLKEAPT
jgi:hypothetical protein